MGVIADTRGLLRPEAAVAPITPRLRGGLLQARTRCDEPKGGNGMQRNVGTAERLVRIIIGVVLLALTVVGPRTWWGLVGLVPLGTALWGW